ncbi:MAG: hypothetical protein H6709_21470 [Kofleriaceae bacterium]|nr:hypothetical protein [Myxococcales bacterium]MCB9574655.1 hypothetical protein [Kofleriaceae bacterium]
MPYRLHHLPDAPAAPTSSRRDPRPELFGRGVPGQHEMLSRLALAASQPSLARRWLQVLRA